MPVLTMPRFTTRQSSIGITIELQTPVITFGLLVNGRKQNLVKDDDGTLKIEISFDERDQAARLEFEIYGTCNKTEEYFFLKLLFSDEDEIVESKQLQIPVYHGNFHAKYQQINNVKGGFAIKADQLQPFDFLIPEVPDSHEDPGGEIKVIYGTNRNYTGSNEPASFYGIQRSDLQTGICTISIPPGHKKGEIERPARFLKYFFSLRKESKTRDVVLTSVEPYQRDDFHRIIKDSLALSGKKSALIFIHGYNTSFEEAAWRTGQLAYDLPFNGVTGFFSWPSQAKLTKYGADIEFADSSIHAFIKFIDGLINVAGIEELHFIAHSMGNRILTSALKELKLRGEYASAVQNISQVILAAPDLDKETFETFIFPEFIQVGKRHTLYASDKDKALKASKQLMRDGRRRLGDAGGDIFIKTGIDSIDASNVESDDNNHSYMFEEKEILNDLYFILEENRPPAKRQWLKPRNNPKGTFWIFPV